MPSVWFWGSVVGHRTFNHFHHYWRHSHQNEYRAYEWVTAWQRNEKSESFFIIVVSRTSYVSSKLLHNPFIIYAKNRVERNAPCKVWRCRELTNNCWHRVLFSLACFDATITSCIFSPIESILKVLGNKMNGTAATCAKVILIELQ